MDFFSIVNTRRSIRSFRPDPVPREDLEKIVAAGLEAPSGCNMQSKQFILVDDAAVLARIRALCGATEGAPAAIVVAMDPAPTQFGEFWVQDASAAMENMLLAAVALGYGACWVEGAVRRHEETLGEILGVPKSLRVWSLTPIGRPAQTPSRPPKPLPAEVTHYNRFGRLDTCPEGEDGSVGAGE